MPAAVICAGWIWMSRAGVPMPPAMCQARFVISGSWKAARSGATPINRYKVPSVTLVNTSRKSCRLELTTYLELALASHRSDRAHPAFSKLFIETEWFPHCEALLAHRRLRAPDEQPIWAAHLLVPESSSFPSTTEFETDRAQFLGRGRTPENPVALSRNLTNGVGTVLDPIFSLRRQITILPNQRFQFALVTVVGESREIVIRLAE